MATLGDEIDSRTASIGPKRPMAAVLVDGESSFTALSSRESKRARLDIDEEFISLHHAGGDRGVEAEGGGNGEGVEAAEQQQEEGEEGEENDDDDDDDDDVDDDEDGITDMPRRASETVEIHSAVGLHDDLHGDAFSSACRKLIDEHELQQARRLFDGTLALQRQTDLNNRPETTVFISADLPRAEDDGCDQRNMLPLRLFRSLFFTRIAEAADYGLRQIIPFKPANTDVSILALYASGEQAETAVAKIRRPVVIGGRRCQFNAQFVTKPPERTIENKKKAIEPSIRAFAEARRDVVQTALKSGQLDFQSYQGFNASTGDPPVVAVAHNPLADSTGQAVDGHLQADIVEDKVPLYNYQQVESARNDSETTKTTEGFLQWELCVEPGRSVMPELLTGSRSTFEFARLTSEIEGRLALEEPPPRVLCTLTKNERLLQRRYWGSADDYALARCPICGKDGHTDDNCPARTCRRCGLRDDHFLIACPDNVKCTRCKDRGHSIQECSFKLARSTADGFSCDACKQRGHPEEMCSLIWRTYNPEELHQVKHVDGIVLSCYDCGGNGHLGDDCITRRGRKRVNTSIFSATHANRYLDPVQQVVPKAGFSIRGRAKQKSVTNPGDEDHGPSNFYRKVKDTLPPKEKSASIKINIRNRPRYPDGGALYSNPPSYPRGHRYNSWSQNMPTTSGGGSSWQPPLPKGPVPPLLKSTATSRKKSKKRPPPTPVSGCNSV